MIRYRGSCHCGAIAFEAEGEIERVTHCNCSLCSRAGYLHWYVPPDRFRLLCSEAKLSTYTFNTRTARHHFCPTCGVSPFRRPRSDPKLYDINVRCLQNVDAERFPVDHFDGKNWEQAEAAGQLQPLRKLGRD